MTGSVTVITAAKEIENNSFRAIDQILKIKVARFVLLYCRWSSEPGPISDLGGSIRSQVTLKNRCGWWMVLPFGKYGVASINVVNAGNIQESILDHGIGNIAPTDIESITVIQRCCCVGHLRAQCSQRSYWDQDQTRGFEGKATFNYNGSFGMVEAPVSI